MIGARLPRILHARAQFKLINNCKLTTCILYIGSTSTGTNLRPTFRRKRELKKRF